MRIFSTKRGSRPGGHPKRGWTEVVAPAETRIHPRFSTKRGSSQIDANLRFLDETRIRGAPGRINTNRSNPSSTVDSSNADPIDDPRLERRGRDVDGTVTREDVPSVGAGARIDANLDLRAWKCRSP